MTGLVLCFGRRVNCLSGYASPRLTGGGIMFSSLSVRPFVRLSVRAFVCY